MKNIDKVINFLEDEEAGFDMNVWKSGDPTLVENRNPGCGTVMCIGGTAEHIMLTEDPDLDDIDVCEIVVMRWLTEDIDIEDVDLDYMGDELFFGGHLNMGSITREMAISTLEHLRDTGEVIWNK